MVLEYPTNKNVSKRKSLKKGKQRKRKWQLPPLQSARLFSFPFYVQGSLSCQPLNAVTLKEVSRVRKQERTKNTR